MVGVDTYGDVHVACAIDQLGRRLAIAEVATTPTGSRALLEWAREVGQVEVFGAEAAPAVLAGQLTAIPSPSATWWSWCGVCGWRPGQRGQGPQPGLQRSPGSGGDRSAPTA